MRLARASAANQDNVALLSDEAAAARSRTRPSLIGVPSNSKPSTSFANGSLAMVN